jgi:hypothetical protein
MRKSTPNRTRVRAQLSPASALAMGPWCLALACNVYDAGMVNGAAGGSGGGGNAGSGAEAGNHMGEGAAAAKAGTDTGASGGSGGTAGAHAGTSSGSGGSSGTQAGGSAGSGGSAGAAGGTAPLGDPEAIDDMEDNDAQITPASGRNGYWYVGNDGTASGTQEPAIGMFKMFKLPDGELPDSTYAAHMKVEGFTLWGAVLGFNFNQQLGKPQPYDASEFCGVSYWGKAAAATTLRFRLPDGDTHPEGKVCTDGGPAGEACYDHFGTSAAFTTTWQKFTVMFASLEQIGTGYHPEDMMFKADQMFGLEWALPGSGKAYEIWVDDVSFLKCQ